MTATNIPKLHLHYPTTCIHTYIPSFLRPFSQEKCRKTGQVARSICILDHLPAGLGDAMSAQIIIPGPQANKRSDVYVMVLTKQLEVCPGHLILAIVSTRIDNPSSADPFAECAPGFALLGDIKVRIMDGVFFCLLHNFGA
jgi:Rab GDP dissociation inhibitor